MNTFIVGALEERDLFFKAFSDPACTIALDMFKCWEKVELEKVELS